MKRLVYLDVLRGIAILLMVVDHAYDWWLDSAGHATGLAATTKFLGTLAAPLFLYLVGVGLALSTLKADQTGARRGKVVRHLILRGAKLVLYGYILNLPIFFVGSNPADILAVDILQIIGVTIWLSVPFLWAPSWVVAVVTGFVFVVGQTAGGWILPDPIAAFVTGNGGIGYFPLAVWLAYTYLGLAVGKAIGTSDRAGRVMKALVICGVLALVTIPLVDPGWGYRHPRPMFVLFSLAVLFSLTALLWLWIDRLNKGGPLLAILRDMGLASLMLYVFHHLVCFRLFWIFGWVSGRSWRGEYGLFDPISTTILFSCLLGLMMVAAHAWVRYRNRLFSWGTNLAKRSFQKVSD
jgi:uncharacterized membrane protein